MMYTHICQPAESWKNIRSIPGEALQISGSDLVMEGLILSEGRDLDSLKDQI